MPSNNELIFDPSCDGCQMGTCEGHAPNPGFEAVTVGGGIGVEVPVSSKNCPYRVLGGSAAGDTCLSKGGKCDGCKDAVSPCNCRHLGGVNDPHLSTPNCG